MSQAKAIVETVNVPVDKIKPSPYQPRLTFDLEDIRGSIKRDGILIPLTVREREGYYELIDGERRVRLAKELGYKTVPCTVIKVDDDTARRMVWKVNTLRQDYTPKEKAYHFRSLQEKYGMSLRGMAMEYGIDRHTIKAYLNTFRLPDEYQQMVWDRVIPIGVVKELEVLLNSGVYPPSERLTSEKAPEIFEILDRASREKYFGQKEAQESIRPYLKRLRQEQVEKAKVAVERVEPEVRVPETPEELEEAARVLREEAKRRKTPKQKHREIVGKAQKALSSFPSLENAEKLGVDIKVYKKKLEKIESYLKEKPKEAWDDISSLKKEFKAEIKEAQIHREEEEEKRREEEMQRRIEEEAKRRARELEEAEKRRIEEEARKKAQEEILTTPELLQEVAERAREERDREFAIMEERAREAAGEIAGPLREALLRAEQDIREVKDSEKRRFLENFMVIGSILATLEKGLIFDIEHEDEEQMLIWKSGTPLTQTHKQLRKKLGIG